jgi:hypothetical protein
MSQTCRATQYLHSRKTEEELKMGRKRGDTQWKQVIRIQTSVRFRVVRERAQTVQKFMTEADTTLLNGSDMSAPLHMFLTVWCWFRAFAAARTVFKGVSKVGTMFLIWSPSAQ